jgi:predicted ribosome quality control (RQC) complex YloA/Tae2 family protein
MSSAFDNLDLLTGSILREVRQPGPESLWLRTFRADSGEVDWLISVHAACPRFLRTFHAPRNLPRPPQFCQWLRARLMDARFGTPVLEPPLVLMIPARRDSEAFSLALEFNGADSNLLLLDRERRLLVALRHPGLPGRSLRPGDAYVEPTRAVPPPKEVPADAWHWAGDESRAKELDAAGRAREQQSELESLRRASLQAAKTEIKRLKRRVENLRSDLAQAQNADRLRQWADLLNIHRRRVAPGTREITVPDEYSPERGEVRIPLDPQLDLSANIERLYRRSRKFKDAVPHVMRRLAETKRALAAWSEALGRVERAASRSELDTLFRGRGARLPDAAARTRAVSGEGEPGVLYRVSSDGYTILLGRSKEANDRVTFRLSNGRDWWFHAQGIPGSHVIVRNPSGGGLPPATVREAAWLAAYYSSRREEGKLDVDYVQRKHVRKIKGAEPGQVTYSQNKTVLVDLGDARAAAVLGETGSIEA